MFDPKQLLMTGGGGLLGGEIRALLPEADYPATDVFDVTNYAQMEEYLKGKTIDVLLHAGAFTSPPKVDQDPTQALDVNIIGTANMTKLCMKHGIRLVYVCTDYVFKGDRGNYKEEDPVLPVNKYAWSKLGGECALHLYDNSLIIRTSFGPNLFPYEKAFSDQWTSRESVGTIAKKIVTLLQKELTGIIHIGGPRRTVLEYAQSLDPSKSIQPLSTKDVSFTVPVDTSLDCSKYDESVQS